jgi:chemotaxis protein methyltransferase CheR
MALPPHNGAVPAVGPLVDLGLRPDDAGMSDREFEQLRALVRAQTGIALGPQKRHLLRARLDRRLRALGLSTFAQYCAYLTEGRHPEELVAFVNAVTTNKTDFFREPHHFAHLAEHWAPALRAGVQPGHTRRVRIWSAASSSGEEPYTIAMVLREAGIVAPVFDVRILASDIDTDVLAHASEGVYAVDRTTAVPPDLLRRYFLRSRRQPTHVRVRPELRDVVTFRRINFADSSWPIRVRFDVIFCRNALIYFDRAGQQAILGKLLAFLEPGGLLFLGHSESVLGLAEGLTPLGNTIYARAAAGAQGDPA